jgi:hypothetical protein
MIVIPLEIPLSSLNKRWVAGHEARMGRNKKSCIVLKIL